jgi:hypothetical protein
VASGRPSAWPWLVLSWSRPRAFLTLTVSGKLRILYVLSATNNRSQRAFRGRRPYPRTPLAACSARCTSAACTKRASARALRHRRYIRGGPVPATLRCRSGSLERDRGARLGRTQPAARNEPSHKGHVDGCSWACRTAELMSLPRSDRERRGRGGRGSTWRMQITG